MAELVNVVFLFVEYLPEYGQKKTKTRRRLTV
jgi:hypothetical protein